MQTPRGAANPDHYIYVSNKFQIKPGAKITNDLFVGPGLGVGLQGGVFLLQDAQGRPDPDKVLKATFKLSLGGIAGMTHMEREWAVGRRLAPLEKPEKATPGFMATGAALVTRSGVFRGFILERIHGKNSDKRIGKPTFHDITYVRQLLFSTFKALHAAQRQLAFHHADLRLANIMEVDPADTATAPISAEVSRATPPTGASAATAVNATAVNGIPSTAQQAAIHHAKSDSVQDTAVPSTTGLNPQGATAIPSRNPQQSGNWLQSHHDQIMHHFKIIDYGLADFKELFGAGYVRSNTAHKRRRKVDLYRGSSLGKMAVPVTADDAEEGATTAEGYMRAARPIGCVALLPHPSNLLPKVAPIERIYRYFWKRKGDVYALLWDLQRFLDGRVWPLEDELEVALMIDLIRHVTGVKLKAYFVPADAASEKNPQQSLKVQQKFSLCGCFSHNDGFLHILRIRSIRIRSWFKPHNPGLTAAEALTSPFFTYHYDEDFTPNI